MHIINHMTWVLVIAPVLDEKIKVSNDLYKVTGLLG